MTQKLVEETVEWKGEIAIVTRTDHHKNYTEDGKFEGYFSPTTSYEATEEDLRVNLENLEKTRDNYQKQLSEKQDKLKALGEKPIITPSDRKVLKALEKARKAEEFDNLSVAVKNLKEEVDRKQQWINQRLVNLEKKNEN